LLYVVDKVTVDTVSSFLFVICGRHSVCGHSLLLICYMWQTQCLWTQSPPPYLLYVADTVTVDTVSSSLFVICGRHSDCGHILLLLICYMWQTQWLWTQPRLAYFCSEFML